MTNTPVLANFPLVTPNELGKQGGARYQYYWVKKTLISSVQRKQIIETGDWTCIKNSILLAVSRNTGKLPKHNRTSTRNGQSNFPTTTESPLPIYCIESVRRY